MPDELFLPNVLDVDTLAILSHARCRSRSSTSALPPSSRRPTFRAATTCRSSSCPSTRAISVRRSERRRCSSVARGARARQAEQALREAELPRLHVLDGGLAAWEARGLPVNRGRQRWSLERQVRGVAGTLVLVGVARRLARLAPAGAARRRRRWRAGLLGAHRYLRHGAAPGQVAVQPDGQSCDVGAVLQDLASRRSPAPAAAA